MRRAGVPGGVPFLPVPPGHVCLVFWFPPHSDPCVSWFLLEWLRFPVSEPTRIPVPVCFLHLPPKRFVEERGAEAALGPRVDCPWAAGVPGVAAADLRGPGMCDRHLARRGALQTLGPPSVLGIPPKPFGGGQPGSPGPSFVPRPLCPRSLRCDLMAVGLPMGLLLCAPASLTDGSATSPEEVPGCRCLQEARPESVGTARLQRGADPAVRPRWPHRDTQPGPDAARHRSAGHDL